MLRGKKDATEQQDVSHCHNIPGLPASVLYKAGICSHTMHLIYVKLSQNCNLPQISAERMGDLSNIQTIIYYEGITKTNYFLHGSGFYSQNKK